MAFERVVASRTVRTTDGSIAWGPRALPDDATRVSVRMDRTALLLLGGSAETELVVEVSYDGGTNWEMRAASTTDPSVGRDARSGSVLADQAHYLWWQNLRPAPNRLVRGSLRLRRGTAITADCELETEARPWIDPQISPHRSIAVDSVGTPVGTASGTSLSVSHTAAGSDRYALVRWCTGSADIDATSATYGSDALSQQIGTNGPGYLRSHLLRRIAPLTGSQTVTVSWSGAEWAALQVSSYTGVHQTTPDHDPTGSTGTSATPSVTVPSVASTDLVVDAGCAFSGAGGADVGADQISEGVITVSANFNMWGSRQLGSAGGVMSWTISDSDWVTAGMALVEAAAGGAIAAAVTGGASVVAALTGSGALAAAVSGDATLTVQLTGSGTLVVSLGGGASVVAALTGSGALATDIIASATLLAVLGGTGGLVAELIGGAATTAQLTGSGALVVSLGGGASVVADLGGTGDLAAALAGGAVVVAVLTELSGDISAALAGNSTLTAILTGSGALAVVLSGDSAVAASLTSAGEVAQILDVAHVIRATGRIVLDPTNLSAAYPHGGVEIGLVRLCVLQPVVARFRVISEGLGEATDIVASREYVFACVLRGWDDDAIRMLMPGGYAAGSSSQHAVFRRPGTTVPGASALSRAMILLFVPDDPIHVPALLIYRAVPDWQQGASINLQRGEEFSLPLRFHCARDSGGKILQLGMLADLSLS